MKVQFCDLCNESVPQADLDQGRALVLKGRVVCASCDKAMSVAGARGAAAAAVATHVNAPPAAAVAWRASETLAPAPDANAATAPSAPFASSPQTEPRSATSIAPLAPAASAPAGPSAGPSAGLWVAVVGLLFTASAIYVFNDRIRDLAIADRKLGGDLGTQVTRIASVEKTVGGVDASIARSEKSVREAQAFERARVQSELDQLDAAIKNTRSELAGITSALDLLRQESASGQTSWAQRIDEVSQRVAKQEDALRAQGEKLAEVEELALNPPVAAVPSGGAAPAQPVEAAWKALLADLANANSGLRWQAVDGLGQSGDPETIPHLIPMLKDSDVFVRMAAARVLGNLNADAAVTAVDASIGALIDALEDSDSPVREAALVALHQITGRDLAFDPQGNEGERGRKLKSIRDWWKRTTEAGGFKKGAPTGN
ncbi:MAG: HEAT repeat domain-containing protein [Planctomycetes bacterium]|nr:HEAT repeat domain-containing protein [Planctomycetota bacterium]